MNWSPAPPSLPSLTALATLLNCPLLLPFPLTFHRFLPPSLPSFPPILPPPHSELWAVDLIEGICKKGKMNNGAFGEKDDPPRSLLLPREETLPGTSRLSLLEYADNPIQRGLHVWREWVVNEPLQLVQVQKQPIHTY